MLILRGIRVAPSYRRGPPSGSRLRLGLMVKEGRSRVSVWCHCMEAGPNHVLKLTGAALSVLRGTMFFERPRTT